MAFIYQMFNITIFPFATEVCIKMRNMNAFKEKKKVFEYLSFLNCALQTLKDGLYKIKLMC